MEKNKLNSLQRMTDEMRKVVDFEIKQSQEIAQSDYIDPNDKNAYIISRKYWNEGGPTVSRALDEIIDGPYGPIPIRIYYTESAVQSSYNRCIIYIHGGGFVVGNIDTHDGIIRRLAKETGGVILAVDYRLAPNYKFPTQIQECETIFEYIHQNGAKHQIDSNSISLAGDSAGASLCLATTLHMRDTGRDISYIQSLILFYGAYGLKDSMSMRLYGGYWDGLTSEALNSYNSSYLNSEDENSPYRILFNADLTYGIPPTYIMACDIDPLLDDSRLLYEILKEHGTKTKFKLFKGVIHGFLHYSKALPESIEAIKDATNFWRDIGQ